MKSPAPILFALLLLGTTLGARQYDRSIFKEGDLISLETSSRDFFRIELNKPLRRRKSRRIRRRYRRSVPDRLPASLYKTEATTNGHTLTIRRLKGAASVLLLSNPVRYPGSRRRISFGLRSANRLTQNSSFSLNTGKKILGPEQGLFFLGSSETITDPTLGESFRIFIPATAIYGYWEKKIFQKQITAGATLRLLIIGDGVRRCYTITI